MIKNLMDFTRKKMDYALISFTFLIGNRFP